MPPIKFLLSFALVISTAYGQQRFETLDQQLAKVVTKKGLPGLSVVLVDTTGIIYKKSFGFADIASNIPYDSATLQNIGSVSKTFIAIALMKAIELHYFTLETDINDVLPFKVINPNHPDDHITIRELTNHTSGVIDNPAIYPNSYIFYRGLRNYSPATLEALHANGYAEKVRDTSLAAFFYDYLAPKGKYYSSDNFGKGAAGSASSYSNIGSALAAYLIEIRSGLSYAQFTQKYILKPLHMQHSGWFLSSIDLSKHAKLYFTPDTWFPLYNLLTYPDGGLKTSTADLSKYLIALIRGYYGDSTLLCADSYKEMFTPQFSPTSPPQGIKLDKRNKGIFWNLYTNGTIGHDGDDPGVSTFLFLNPQTGMGGLFLCNTYLDDKQPLIDLLVGATKP